MPHTMKPFSCGPAWIKGMSAKLMKLPLPALALISSIGISSPTPAVEVKQPLILESTIPLPNVLGRIDHLAVDLVSKRLYVAELGNNTLDVIDLSVQKVLHRISNLAEPQGVAYVSGPGLIVVANGGDGKVHFFNGADFSPRGTVSLSDDADNVRVDPRSGHVLVGFGTSQIAIIDPAKPEWLSNIPLPSRPESFHLSSSTGRLFVNVPTAGKIVMVDDLTKGTGASWMTNGLKGNFPMALDDTNQAIIVVFSNPAKLATFDMMTGKELGTADACDDSDDVFLDEKRNRIYASCGEGLIDVFERGPKDLNEVARIKTAHGARTSIFVPELDRLYLAVPASSTTGAMIQVYRTGW
jgi:YVTN family beta-propeller protein